MSDTPTTTQALLYFVGAGFFTLLLDIVRRLVFLQIEKHYKTDKAEKKETDAVKVIDNEPALDAASASDARTPERIIAAFAERQGYWTGIASVLTFLFALALFTATPLLPEPNPLLLVEFVIVVVSSLAMVGIALHAFGNRSVYARWSFFTACLATALTTGGFVLGENEVAVLLRLEVFLFLMSGGLVALSLHLRYGGNRNIHYMKGDL